MDIKILNIMVKVKGNIKQIILVEYRNKMKSMILFQEGNLCIEREN